jgi:hypothetical protein
MGGQWGYDGRVPVNAGAGPRKPVESERRKRATLAGGFFMPAIYLWRTARGSLRAGRCPFRPVFLASRQFATIPLGKGFGELLNLKGVPL